MKRICPVGLTIVLLLSFAGAFPISAAVNTDNIPAIVEGNNAFAFDLYSALAEEKGNLFFSPYSISTAFAMTYAGARGETARQMKETLRYNLPDPDLHPGFYALIKKTNASGKGYRLAVANALWGQAGTKFFPDFLKVTKKYYSADFKQVDYANKTEKARQTINAWVEKNTNRKIVELIKPNILTPLTRLVLTNAIYFKGRWKQQFKPEDTKPMPFFFPADETAEVPMMHQLNKFKFTENDRMQILELPYSGDAIAMNVLLPRPGTDIAQLEADLNSANFSSWTAKLNMDKVEVFLPRFKMEKEFSLGGTLKNMGMKDAFDENKADFSGMSRTFLYITKVVHKAFVEVNEEGTEAAAATAVVLGTKSAARYPVFRADHPFIFIIRDLRTGSILFIGRVNDPR